MTGHFDGRRFFNPGAAAGARGLSQVLRWQLESHRQPWPDRIVDPAFGPPPGSVTPGQAAITFIGHSTFLIRLPGTVVLTDPIFSERCSPVSWAGPRRARAPGIALDRLPRPNLVLLSHNHYDHMDLPSLRALHRLHAPHVVTTLGNARSLAREGIAATELDWWQTVELAGLRLTCTPRDISRRALRSTGTAHCGAVS